MSVPLESDTDGLMKYDWTTAEAWGKTGAALLASTMLSLASYIACVTVLPVAQDVGLAIGVLAGLPVWVGTACYAVLARTVVRAWAVPVGIALVLSGGAVLVLFLQ